MGLSPRQLDAMTLWEFHAAVDAWRGFHTVDDDKPEAMSDMRLAELEIEGFA